MDNNQNANHVTYEDISEVQTTDTQTDEARESNVSNNAAPTLGNVITHEESTRDSPMTTNDVTRLLMFLFDASDDETTDSTTARPTEWQSETLTDTVAAFHSTQDSSTLPGGSTASDSTPFWHSATATDSTADALKDLLTTSTTNSSLASLIASFNTSQEKDVREKGLTLPELQMFMEDSRNQGDWSPVIRILSDVFGSYEALSSSFLDSPHNQRPADIAPAKKAKQLTSDAEELTVTATMDVDATTTPVVSLVAPGDDDVVANESSTPITSTSSTVISSVNLVDVRSAWHLIYSVPERQDVVDALMRAVHRLVVMSLHNLLVTQPSRGLDDPFPPESIRNTQQRLLNLFIILYECPFATDPLHFEHLLININRAATWLPYLLQARLCRAWADGVRVPPVSTSPPLPSSTKALPRPENTNLWCLQRILSQLITLRCLTTDHCSPNEDKQLCEAALVLRIVYYASLLAGQMDPSNLLIREVEENHKFETEINPVSVRSTSDELPQDPLASILKISPNDCRVPFIPSKDFVNETLNEIFKPRKDYTYYRTTDLLTELSFMRLPFLLQTSSKIVLLYCDNRMRMLGERRNAYLRSIMMNYPQSPFLKLFVSRDQIVEDALMNLDLICLENPGELKKQLLVEFKDELGVDEGGVSKEFFQLLTEKIFHPIYGMFTFNEELQTYWFNPNPLSDMTREYCLIGVLLGLAIYNDIILNVRFPSIIYRKLVGKLGTFEDLKDARPDLAPGLQALLDYDGEEDLASVIDCNFVISYHDVFGNLVSHELKRKGASIPVTKLNRQEFVDLYADFLLNESISSAFNAFRRGFHMVISDSPLMYLFRPDEIELLVCGSKDYNFKELERATTYTDFTSESPVIVNFWSIVHSMTEEQHRQLLQFATGSDRIPVGGMSSLKFGIVRQGGNTDRLVSGGLFLFRLAC